MCTWVKRITITGGASNILGLRSLLIRELVKTTKIKRYTGCERAPSSPFVDVEFRDVAMTIRNLPPKNPPGTWIGASMIASLRTFQKCFVSKEMYHDNPAIFFQLETGIDFSYFSK
ncbi:MAG: hypothetical protein ACFFB3_01960 [Candidatus Hodarchaeota archaeon]